MEFIEFVEKFVELKNINLLPYQKEVIKQISQAIKEGNEIKIYCLASYGESFYKELLEAYKFEDLYEGMCVWDDIEKLICQIGLISKNAIHRKYIDGTISDSPFEENRFFPVQCANWNGSERW